MDFYLTNYVDFDPDYTPPDSSLCRWRGLSVFCGPVGLQGAADVFYRNDGPQSSWSFSVASAEFGLADYRYYGLGALAGDFDNDGDPDLYIANDSTPNVLYRNDGGRFHDTARISGVAYSENGLEQASMGIAAADYDAAGGLDPPTTMATRTCSSPTATSTRRWTTTGWDRATGSAISCSRTAAMACSAT